MSPTTWQKLLQQSLAGTQSHSQSISRKSKSQHDVLTQLTRSRTTVAAVPNPPLPAEGSASFSNYQLAAVLILGPWIFQKLLPFRTGWTTYFSLFFLLGIPLAIGYWAFMSRFGRRVNEKVALPGKPLDHYLDLKTSNLRHYAGKKVPMQKFHDAYFDGKVDFKGDVLDVMEYRHDWASFEFTPEVGDSDSKS